MLRFLFIIAALFISTAALAQEDNWVAHSDEIKFNCAALEQVMTVINDADAEIAEVTAILGLDFAQINSTKLDFASYFTLVAALATQENPNASFGFDDVFEEAIDTCDSTNTNTSSSSSTASINGQGLFNVTATGNANLRSCAGTSCSVAGQVAVGQVMKVLAVEGEWYEVEYNDGVAYIASWLTARAADNVVDVSEPYVDLKTGCVLAFDIKRGSADMNIILAGDRRNDVIVDLYRPNEGTALKVQSQLDKTFLDTGDPYILQYYSWNIGWPVGLYNIEISLDGETSKFAWEMKDRGDYNIYVYCE